MKRLLNRIKNWIIVKLGGFTREMYCEIGSLAIKTVELQEKHLRIAEGAIEWWGDRCTALEDSIRTIQAEVDAINYGPADQTFDALKVRAKKDIVAQLGEDVYAHSHHTVTEDGKYIVAINIMEDTDE